MKPGKKAEFKAARKEMHKKLLKEKLNDEINSRKNIGTTDMKYMILEDETGNYKVKIYHGDTSVDKEFPWEKVVIEPDYYQNKAFDFDNANNVTYLEEEKKSR